MRVNRALAILRLLTELRRHDLRAARTWLNTMYSRKPSAVRLVLFTFWVLKTVCQSIPAALKWAHFARPVARTPVWLAQGNPFENYPFAADPNARLPAEAEVVVIGAGFAGAAVAYHWSKHGKAPLVVLEMHAPASGSAGRN